MPYKDHPRCITPSHADVKIWRYMDFTQFVSMLERDSLHFTRADEFEDPYEGSLPQQNFNLRNDELENIPDEWIDDLLPHFRELCRKYTFLNCWHINETESAGMWDLYLKADAGICIQSTYQCLVDAIECHSDDDIFISEVEYIDYSKHRLSGWSLQSPLADTLSPFIHKRKSFEHEQELRAIIHSLPWEGQEGDSWVTAEEIGEISLEEPSTDNHKKINIDLEDLIENIYIAPHAPDWIKGLVERVVETHEMDENIVKKSNMTEDPNY